MTTRWATQAEQWLVEQRGQITIAAMAAQLSRSEASVLNKLRRLRRDGLPLLVVEWTAAADVVLRAAYATLDNESIGLAMGRSGAAIQIRAGALGLTNRPRRATTAAHRLWQVLQSQSEPQEALALAEAAMISRKGALRHLLAWVSAGVCARTERPRLGGLGNPKSVVFSLCPDAGDRPPMVQHLRRKPQPE